jgi:hypothetical protein
MSSTEGYRKFAAECERLVRIEEDSLVRERLLALLRSWHALVARLDEAPPPH